MTREANEYFREALTADHRIPVGEKLVQVFDHPENADGGAVVTNFLYATERIVVDEVRYVNVTGLAADAANYGELKLLQGAVEVAVWSTETGQEGTIAADTYVQLTNGTEPNRIVEAGEELTFSVAESGTTTIPAGRFEVHYRVVPDDIEYKVHKAKKKTRITGVDLKVKTAITASDTNYYVFTLKQDAVTVATWSTKTTGGNGALVAETYVSMALSSTGADLVVEADEQLTLDCAETGDSVLSDIAVTVHGELL